MAARKIRRAAPEPEASSFDELDTRTSELSYPIGGLRTELQALLPAVKTNRGRDAVQRIYRSLLELAEHAEAGVRATRKLVAAAGGASAVDQLRVEIRAEMEGAARGTMFRALEKEYDRRERFVRCFIQLADIVDLGDTDEEIRESLSNEYTAMPSSWAWPEKLRHAVREVVDERKKYLDEANEKIAAEHDGFALASCILSALGPERLDEPIELYDLRRFAEDVRRGTRLAGEEPGETHEKSRAWFEPVVPESTIHLLPIIRRA